MRQIKAIGYTATPTLFTILTNFTDGNLFNKKRFCIKLDENLPSITSIVPVSVQITGMTGVLILPITTCRPDNKLMSDQLQNKGQFEVIMGTNGLGTQPIHLQCLCPMRPSAFYPVQECVGTVTPTQFTATSKPTVVTEGA